jgi:hypothetical protein
VAVLSCGRIHQENPCFFYDFKIWDILFNMIKHVEPLVVVQIINVLMNSKREVQDEIISYKLVRFLIEKINEFSDG